MSVEEEIVSRLGQTGMRVVPGFIHGPKDSGFSFKHDGSHWRFSAEQRDSPTSAVKGHLWLLGGE